MPPEFVVGAKVMDSYCKCKGIVICVEPIPGKIQFEVTDPGPKCLARPGTRYCFDSDDLDVID